MESCCIYIYVLWIPSRTVVQCYYFVFHPHESAWWAPLNRFYAGLADFAKTCIGPILRVLHPRCGSSSLGTVHGPGPWVEQPLLSPSLPLALLQGGIVGPDQVDDL